LGADLTEFHIASTFADSLAKPTGDKRKFKNSRHSDLVFAFSALTGERNAPTNGAPGKHRWRLLVGASRKILLAAPTRFRYHRRHWNFLSCGWGEGEQRREKSSPSIDKKPLRVQARAAFGVFLLDCKM